MGHPRSRGRADLCAIFLIMIAAFYLAFASYFGMATAWQVETAVVVAFVATGVLGVRLRLALIVGYPLHGPWDQLELVVT